MTEEALITPEKEAEQAEADFAKGCDAAAAQATPAKTEAKTTETQKEEPKPEVKAEAKPEAKAEVVVEQKPSLIGGLTEEEWNTRAVKAAGVDKLQEEIRKNFGQIGELKKSIAALSERLAAGTQTGTARKLTAQALKRVHADFPDLAESLAADLSEALAETKAEEKKADDKQQPFDPEAYFLEKISPALQDMEARANEKAELRIVKQIHRDFETVVRSTEFATWLGTLSAEKQKEIRESEDGFVAADAVTAFKEQAKKAVETKERSKTRLEAAVTPQGETGVGPLPKDEEALFAEGFKKADRAYAR